MSVGDAHPTYTPNGKAQWVQPIKEQTPLPTALMGRVRCRAMSVDLPEVMTLSIVDDAPTLAVKLE